MNNMQSRSIIAFYAVLMNLLLVSSFVASRSSRGFGSSSLVATSYYYWKQPALAFSTTTMTMPRTSRKRKQPPPPSATTVDDNDSSSSSRKRTTKRSSSSSSRRQSKTKDNDNKEQAKAATTATTKSKTQYFLMKSEPDVFSIDNLQLKREENWDGVRNFQARNIMRTMKHGDIAYFYHSSCKIPGIVGTMKIVSEKSFPDVTALDPNHDGYDEKSTSLEKCRWDCVRVQYQSTFDEPVTLTELKELATNGNNTIIANMKLLRNSRLSVQDLTQEEYDIIQELAQQKKTKNKKNE